LTVVVLLPSPFFFRPGTGVKPRSPYRVKRGESLPFFSFPPCLASHFAAGYGPENAASFLPFPSLSFPALERAPGNASSLASGPPGCAGRASFPPPPFLFPPPFPSVGLRARATGKIPSRVTKEKERVRGAGQFHSFPSFFFSVDVRGSTFGSRSSRGVSTPPFFLFLLSLQMKIPKDSRGACRRPSAFSSFVCGRQSLGGEPRADEFSFLFPMRRFESSRAHRGPSFPPLPHRPTTDPEKVFSPFSFF